MSTSCQKFCQAENPINKIHSYQEQYTVELAQQRRRLEEKGRWQSRDLISRHSFLLALMKKLFFFRCEVQLQTITFCFMSRLVSSSLPARSLAFYGNSCFFSCNTSFFTLADFRLNSVVFSATLKLSLLPTFRKSRLF